MGQPSPTNPIPKQHYLASFVSENLARRRSLEPHAPPLDHVDYHLSAVTC
jgi:hypothetical protein